MTDIVVAKYELPVSIEEGGVRYSDSFSMDLPAGAQPLAVDGFDDYVLLYVLVDPAAELERRDFWLVETGKQKMDAKDYLHYIGSFGSKDRHMVFHLFERISETARLSPRAGKKVN